MYRSPALRLPVLSLVALALITSAPFADTTAQPPPFTQDWSDTSAIVVNHDWSGVPGIVGYSGSGLASSTTTDPQTVLDLRSRLRQRGADAPIMEVGDQLWIRVSAQAYNRIEDYEELADIVTGLERD